MELSAIFCDNLILSSLTTTSRIKGKSCADCGNYTTRARGFIAERKISAKVTPVDITIPDPEDITPERIKHVWRHNIKRGRD